jgi:type I restriction enzyme, R subunit
MFRHRGKGLVAKLTEEDIKLRYITPAIQQAGWDRTQFRMEYFFTDGQVLVRGKMVRRGSRKNAD